MHSLNYNEYIIDAVLLLGEWYDDKTCYIIIVDSTTHMVGSYGPKQDEHTYMTPSDEAPSGMLMRGAYK